MTTRLGPASLTSPLFSATKGTRPAKIDIRLPDRPIRDRASPGHQESPFFRANPGSQRSVETSMMTVNNCRITMILSA